MLENPRLRLFTLLYSLARRRREDTERQSSQFDLPSMVILNNEQHGQSSTIIDN